MSTHQIKGWTIEYPVFGDPTIAHVANAAGTHVVVVDLRWDRGPSGRYHRRVGAVHATSDIPAYVLGEVARVARYRAAAGSPLPRTPEPVGATVTTDYDQRHNPAAELGEMFTAVAHKIAQMGGDFSRPLRLKIWKQEIEDEDGRFEALRMTLRGASAPSDGGEG